MRKIIAGLALALAILLPSVGQAQMSCMSRLEFFDFADEWKGERVFYGITEDGVLYELYVFPTGQWKLMGTTPQGLVCPLKEGHDASGMFINPKRGTNV